MHRLTGQWSDSADFSHDRPVSLTSCDTEPDPFIASGTGRDITATHTLTVACKHIVSREMILILMAFSVNGDW